MRHILNFFNKPLYKHILFWVVVFLFYTTSAKERFDTVEEVVVTYFFHVLYQIIVAYTILYYIVPNYRKTKNVFALLFLVFLLFLFISFLSVTVRMLFLEKAYPNCYKVFLSQKEEFTFWRRVLDVKNIFGYLLLFYVQPLFFLVALIFYEKQYKLSRVREQKKEVELRALKHQLNPHFLFNTLNNLYALSVEKSDKALDVIEKLSDILDYMVYGSDEKFVPIQQEVELIENYLALEQVRYEDRVLVFFKNTITRSCKIAPLLLLTFIENAFKHGVSQELKMATIKISLIEERDYVVFSIFNTKPSLIVTKEIEKKSIGLKNVRLQLGLLYPNNTYDLKIEETTEDFLVTLKLKKQ